MDAAAEEEFCCRVHGEARHEILVEKKGKDKTTKIFLADHNYLEIERIAFFQPLPSFLERQVGVAVINFKVTYSLSSEKGAGHCAMKPCSTY